MQMLFELLYNFGMLVAMSFISGFIGHTEEKNWKISFSQGVLFGSASLIGMLHPLIVAPGLIFDGRSVMISLAAMFFGPIAASIAALMAFVLRVSQGGSGVVMGCLVIIMSASVGSIFYLHNKKKNIDITISSIFTMAIIVHVAMILLMFTLPGDTGIRTIKLLGLPVMVSYPIVTVLIGRILLEVNERGHIVTELQKSKRSLSDANDELNAALQQLVATEEELRDQYYKLQASEEKFRTIFEQAPLGITLKNSLTGLFEEVNSKFAQITGRTIEEINHTSWKDITHPEEVQENLDKVSLMHDEQIKNFNMNKRYIKPEGDIVWVNITVAALESSDKQNQNEICLIEDITERKANEEALIASENNFKKLFEGSPDPILIMDQNKFIDCNKATLELLNYNSKEELIGVSPLEISPEMQPDGTPSKEKFIQLIKWDSDYKNKRFEWWHHKKDGTLFPVEIMMTAILLNGKKVFHIVWRDISERKQFENKLEYLSYHDQLTGLYNRRFYQEELNRMDTARNLPLTIVMGDVNGLKLVNDSFGHAVGDELLKKVAKVLKEACRYEDIIARLGGDEFVILLPKTNILEADEIIKRINALAALEKVASIDISISFGYESKNDMEENIQEVIRRAEDHMYKIKLFESPSMRGKTIKAIINTLYEKNKREELHSRRVSEFCENMGRAMNLTEEEIQEMKTMGLLHDIGKIAIEEGILNKPGKLTEAEWEEVKRHPEIGYRILSTVNDMSEMADYVLYHHERWDGTGYPKGLQKEEIPLLSRIIAIADAYDAMTSDRSYRETMSKEEAITQLKENAGTQFDPKHVALFVENVIQLSK